ncbi:glycosyltransferase family 8 [Fusarium albosuccineum]|uniref:Glycosyltransferase family 8 n=1 Tax=Fusarium albosuccineum TaxID=1237068 RepID=A0A8H4KNH8_9HYPO|nr:glycosyltransferase family 8 [Fusarium albosuccineum]
MVLAESLKNTQTSIPMCAMIVAEAVNEKSQKQLYNMFDDVVSVERIRGIGDDNLKAIGRPDLGDTLTKLQVWSRTQFDRVLFLDADTLVLSNLDHLFDLPSAVELAACPDPGFSDCFNSGVMLLKPSDSTFSELRQFAAVTPSFDGGDQGLLNIFFGDGTRHHPCKTLDATQSSVSKLGESGERNWYRLSFTYNMAMHKVYRLYIPAALRYKNEHKILHFIGKMKPWHFEGGQVPLSDDSSPYERFYADRVNHWWQVRRSLMG